MRICESSGSTSRCGIVRRCPVQNVIMGTGGDDR